MGIQVGKYNGADKDEDKAGDGKVFVEFEGFGFLMLVGCHMRFTFPLKLPWKFK
jgi:hypothetical protein